MSVRAQRAAAAVAAAATLAALAVGCGGGGGGVPAGELVRRAGANAQALRSFHFVLDITGAPRGGTGLTLRFAEGDVAVPGRVRADIVGTIAGIPLQTRLVAIGARTFVEDPFTRRWRRIETQRTALSFLDPARGIAAAVRAATGARRAATARVGERECALVRASVAAARVEPLVGADVRSRRVPVELCIGEDDLQLHRLRLRGAVAVGDPPRIVRTIELSRFNVPVTIGVPE